jgi:hypothetical protein
MKVFTCLTAVGLVLTMVGSASAAAFYFNGGGADSLWATPENWNPVGVPGSDVDPSDITSDVVIARGASGKRALFDSGNATVQVLTMWGGDAVDGFDMTGGTINVNEGGRMGMGSNETNVPIEVNVSGGVINNNAHGWVGGTTGGTRPIMSDGVLNVSGTGQMNVAAYFRVAHEDLVGESDGTLNLSGSGVVSVGTLLLSTAGNGLITIADTAKLWIDGNVVADMYDHIGAGRITGPDVGANYSAGMDKTVVGVGIPEPSTFVLAALGLLGILGYGLRRRSR